MPNYAQLNNDNIAVAITQTSDVILLANMIEIASMDTPILGKKYENGEFIDAPATPQPSIITKLALLNRMTDAEFIGILNAAKTDAEVELWKTRFDNAGVIDLSDGSRVVAGFPMLVTKDLLTQERATKILTDPIQINER